MSPAFLSSTHHYLLNSPVSPALQSIVPDFPRVGQSNRFCQFLSACVLSWLDYCNSLFVNLPSLLLDTLQRAQNKAACTVFRGLRADRAPTLPCHLHWLSVRAGIVYKINTPCYCLFTWSLYCATVVPCHQSRSLWSACVALLSVSRLGREKFCRRSFSFSDPSVFNSLPFSLSIIPIPCVCHIGQRINFQSLASLEFSKRAF